MTKRTTVSAVLVLVGAALPLPGAGAYRIVFHSRPEVAPPGAVTSYFNTAGLEGGARFPDGWSIVDERDHSIPCQFDPKLKLAEGVLTMAWLPPGDSVRLVRKGAETFPVAPSAADTIAGADSRTA